MPQNSKTGDVGRLIERKEEDRTPTHQLIKVCGRLTLNPKWIPSKGQEMLQGGLIRPNKVSNIPKSLKYSRHAGPKECQNPSEG